MRPAYIGFSLAWIVFTLATSSRLLFNAPVIFFVFLAIPVILLAYGLLADEPTAKKGPGPGAPQPGQPGDGTVVPAEVRHGAPGQPYPRPPPAGTDTGRPAYREAFAYAKGAVAGKAKQWALLILATILFLVPLSGYLINVLRGEDPAPEVREWKKLATDGIAAILIAGIYLLPSILVMLGIVSVLNTMVYATRSDPDSLSRFLILIGLPVFLIVTIPALVCIPVALVRFARTGAIGEAFRFGAIPAVIGKIGFLSYFGAVILIAAVNVIFFMLTFIPLVGLVICIALFPPAAVFEARFFCLVYDRAGRM